MSKPFAKAFYSSKAWIDCRKSYIGKRILIDGGMCERCKQEPGYILHHKIVLTASNITDPNITLNHCNLEYVCKSCHEKEHYELDTGRQASVAFGTDGQIVPERA